MEKSIIKKMILISFVFISLITNADIRLSNSGIYLEMTDKEEVFYIENLSNYPTIVYAKEDEKGTRDLSGQSLVFISPPISKVEPNQKQLIRIITKVNSIDVQKMARVLIQEIPYVQDSKQSQVAFNKAYNIPVLLNPKDLVTDYEPWKKAKKKRNGNVDELINDSRYLIKMMPSYTCIKNNKKNVFDLSSPYLKPKSKLELNKNCDSIIINPITNEGQILDDYEIK